MRGMIGQDALRAQLERSIEMGRLAHAMLIRGSGRRGQETSGGRAGPSAQLRDRWRSLRRLSAVHPHRGLEARRRARHRRAGPGRQDRGDARAAAGRRARSIRGPEPRLHHRRRGADEPARRRTACSRRWKSHRTTSTWFCSRSSPPRCCPRCARGAASSRCAPSPPP